MSLDKDRIVAEAGNVAQMLWAAELIAQDVSIPDEFNRRSAHSALATMRGARQLLEKLVDEMDRPLVWD